MYINCYKTRNFFLNLYYNKCIFIVINGESKNDHFSNQMLSGSRQPSEFYRSRQRNVYCPIFPQPKYIKSGKRDWDAAI